MRTLHPSWLNFFLFGAVSFLPNAHILSLHVLHHCWFQRVASSLPKWVCTHSIFIQPNVWFLHRKFSHHPKWFSTLRHKAVITPSHFLIHLLTDWKRCGAEALLPLRMSLQEAQVYHNYRRFSECICVHYWEQYCQMPDALTVQNYNLRVRKGEVHTEKQLFELRVELRSSPKMQASLSGRKEQRGERRKQNYKPAEMVLHWHKAEFKLSVEVNKRGCSAGQQILLFPGVVSELLPTGVVTHKAGHSGWSLSIPGRSPAAPARGHPQCSGSLRWQLLTQTRRSRGQAGK